MPMATIINASTVIVAVFEKPEIASSGFTKPHIAKDTIMKSAILSTGKIGFLISLKTKIWGYYY